MTGSTKPHGPVGVVLTLSFLTLFLGAATARDLTSPNLADVVTATFVGGEGAEWLSAAAFPGDDSILIGGTTLEPELAIRGVKATVLGKDAPALPVVKEFRHLGSGDTGKVAIPQVEEGLPGDDGPGFSLDEKPTRTQLEQAAREAAAKAASVPRSFQFAKRRTVEAQEWYAKFSWLDPQACGFIGRFDSSLKELRALCRFPRGSCAITSMATDSNGNVYVTGFANDRITGASEDCREEKSNRFTAGASFGGDRHVFLARVAPDLQKVVWLRQLKCKAYAPVLRVLNDGNISMLGPAYTVFSPDGRLLQATGTPFRRVSSGSAVCPVTGRYTLVGDWLGRTGREPMRVPRLLVNFPDGRRYKHLQTWDSSFFCPNFEHLVADSAVRRSAYDHEGNLVYSTWSHGGNNCPGRLPYDCDKHIPNAMGYGGMSTYCYVVKLDPDHWVKTGMLWTSAGGINLLAAACDASIAWVGSAHPCWTPNAVSKAETRPLLVLAEPNLTSFRFFSSAPACGTRVVVGGCDDMDTTWSVASGRCGGRPMLVYLSGAVASEPDLAVTNRPPLRNPSQTYGGGLMDGYAILLDLTPKTELGMELPKPQPPPPPKPGEKPEPPKREEYKGILVWPNEGQVFKIGEEKCITVMVTVRDEHDKMWPNFFSGRGVKGGTFVFGTNSASANFTLDAPGLQQSSGLQKQRVLGELTEEKEEVDAATGEIKSTGTGIDVHAKLVVTGSSPWKRTDELYGVIEKSPYCRCTLSGTFHLGNRAIPVTDADCKAVFLSPSPSRYKVSGPNGAYLDIHFTVPGKEMGLAPPLADQKIRIRFRCESVSDVKVEINPDGNVLPPPSLDQ
jgi:hypothetical protein